MSGWWETPQNSDFMKLIIRINSKDPCEIVADSIQNIFGIKQTTNLNRIENKQSSENIN